MSNPYYPSQPPNFRPPYAQPQPPQMQNMMQQQKQLQMQQIQQMQQLQQMQLQQNMQHMQPKPFPGLGPQSSILGTPPPAAVGMAAGQQGRAYGLTPTTGVFNRNLAVGRGGPLMPVLTPSFKKTPLSIPHSKSNNDILAKLRKLVPELNNAEKFTTNARSFIELLEIGLGKNTATNFYAALERLAANIGSEEFNKASLYKIFEFAYLRKYAFAGNSTQLENIAKWKGEVEALVNPVRNGEHAAVADAQAPTAKRARTVSGPQKVYSVVEVGQQVEVLQEELLAVKEELRLVRECHKREVEYLYQHLGLSPPAPPEPEFTVETEHSEAVADPSVENTETVENAEHAEQVEQVEGEAADGTGEAGEATTGEATGNGEVEGAGEVEMAETTSNGNTA